MSERSLPPVGTHHDTGRHRAPSASSRLHVKLAAILASTGLVFAACGGDDDSATDEPEEVDESGVSVTIDTPVDSTEVATGDSGPAEDTDPADGDASGTLAEYEQQELSWGPCELLAGAEGDLPVEIDCATARVPIDYDDPTAGDTEIAMLRIGSTGDAVGSMFLNPGGPGAAAQEFALERAAEFSPDVVAMYDLIGFDPRGIGASNPVDCLDTADLDDFLATDTSPDDDAETQQLADEITALGQGCAARSGDLASHMTTVETARDLDILRAAVGDDVLNYVGESYGTYLGATYAALFPDRVGRLVLDGAMSPDLSIDEILLGQASGLERALQAYIADCIDAGDCPLGDDPDAATETVRTITEAADAEPLPTQDPDRPLTQSLAYYGIAQPMYVPDEWPVLTEALGAAVNGDGSGLLALSDLYTQRGPDGYTSSVQEAQKAVNCLDSQLRPNRPVDEQAFADASTTWAPFLMGLNFCDGWPLTTTVESPDYTAPGAAPIVVVGTTRDPATPYEWAQALADQLESGVLITRDGDGHTGYLVGNECVDAAVDAYLVDGDVPADGTSC